MEKSGNFVSLNSLLANLRILTFKSNIGKKRNHLESIYLPLLLCHIDSCQVCEETLEHRPTSTTNVCCNIQNAIIVVNKFTNAGVVRLWNLAKCISKGDALKHLLPVLRNLLSLHSIFVSTISGQRERKLEFSRNMPSPF